MDILRISLILFMNIFYHTSKGLNLKTGLNYACSRITLECAREERIWARRAFLVNLPPNLKTSAISAGNSGQNCSVDYKSLLDQPYCDITDVVVFKCSNFFRCEVSLNMFAHACPGSNKWTGVAVIVDDFACLPSNHALVAVE